MKASVFIWNTYVNGEWISNKNCKSAKSVYDFDVRNSILFSSAGSFSQNVI